MSKFEWCNGCGPTIHEDGCIIQDADFADMCPCGECIVKPICTFASQACDKFMFLYDMSDNILKERGYKKEFL
jgi:hypothetical protein